MGRLLVFNQTKGILFFLKKHLELNKIFNVFIKELALLDNNGVSYFEEETSSYVGKISANKTKTKVRTLTLYEYVSCHTTPDVVKMDIEGAEVKALNGCRLLLDKFNPVIFYQLMARIYSKIL